VISKYRRCASEIAWIAWRRCEPLTHPRDASMTLQFELPRAARSGVALFPIVLALAGCAATITQDGVEQRTAIAIGRPAGSFTISNPAEGDGGSHRLQREHQGRQDLQLLPVFSDRFPARHVVRADAALGRHLHGASGRRCDGRPLQRAREGCRPVPARTPVERPQRRPPARPRARP
jgi:hypothetical protein